MGLLGRRLRVSFEDHLERPAPPVQAIVHAVCCEGGTKEHTLVFRLVTPFVSRDTACEFFVASARHTGPSYQQSVFDVLDFESVYCRLIRISAEQADGPTPCDTSWWRAHLGFATMGAIWLDEPAFLFGLYPWAAKIWSAVRRVGAAEEAGPVGREDRTGSS